MAYDRDIYYLVVLKDNIDSELFYKSTIRNKLCGRLVNQHDGNFYFELNGSNALVIIPHEWIKWMAPSNDIKNEYTKIYALEKQMPKEPIKKHPIVYQKDKDGQEHYAYKYHCPLCDRKIKLFEHHCPCGQALDWSDTE